MNVEALYKSDGAQIKPSPAIGFLNILLTIIWWAGWAFMALFTLVSLYTILAFLGVKAVQRRRLWLLSRPSALLLWQQFF